MAVPPGARSVFTDGACSGNPGPGGWAWALDTTEFASGHEAPLDQPADGDPGRARGGPVLVGSALVVSDSTYVVNCFRDRWYAGWQARGWTTSAKKPVANRDLWEPLVKLVTERGDVAFQWVKGHSGHEMNDFVDQLAVEASRQAGTSAAAPNETENRSHQIDTLW